MLYDNFMRAKMKNLSKYKMAIGYPCEFESSKEQELIDYRIYGNNGGVGDKTGNLIDYNTIPTIYNTAGITYVRDRDVITANGTLTSKFSIYTLYKGDGWDKVEPNKTYFVSCGNEVNDGVRRYTLYLFINNKQTGDIVKYASSPGTFILGENDVITYIQLRIYSNTDELFTVENEQFKIMIKEDDGSSEYEPYGYKIPVWNSGDSVTDSKNIFPIGHEENITIGWSNNSDWEKKYGGIAIKVKPNTVYTVAYNTFEITENIEDAGGIVLYLYDAPDYQTTITKAPPVFYQKSLGTYANYLKFNTGDNTIIYPVMRNNNGKQVKISFSAMRIYEGSFTADTMPPYQPYGINVGTLYLDEPLNESEYAEYKTQSIHRADGTNEQVELPSITIPQGNVVLTTNTDVEASKISVKYK